jgi:AraC family transcriptional regulator, arabinose operon regulatory protein
VLSVRYLKDQPIFRQADLAIRGIGIHEVMPPCFISRPSTGDFLLMLFHDAVDFGTRPQNSEIPAGNVVIWRPGDPHHYGRMASTWSHSWIHFSGRYADRVLRDAGARFSQPAAAVNEPAVLRHLVYLHEELTVASAADAAIVRATLLLLLREATRHCRSADPHRAAVPTELAIAMKLITDRYAEPLTLTRLADAAGLSVPHFCSRFRKQFGITPMACLVRRRLEVASVLLRCTDGTVAAIGARVGYPDPAHFSKVFAAHYDVAPSRLRGT